MYILYTLDKHNTSARIRTYKLYYIGTIVTVDICLLNKKKTKLKRPKYTSRYAFAVRQWHHIIQIYVGIRFLVLYKLV